MAARLFLFHGTDSRASYHALQTWQTLFAKKYGEATRYVFDADELPFIELAKQLAGVLEAQTLFAAPKLILIKRLSRQDKTKAATVTKQVLSLLAERLKSIDDQVTFAFWEEQELAVAHPLAVQFATWEQKDLGKVTQFSLPTGRALPGTIARFVEKEGGSIDQGGIALIVASYDNLEKHQRNLKRLKTAEPLLDDERSWWLHGVIAAALLLSPDGITEETVRKVGGAVPEPTPVFSVADALLAGDWSRTSTLLRNFEASAEDGDYFALYAALKWKITSGRLSNDQREYLLQVMASIEILVKNFPVPHGMILALLATRLEGSRPGFIISPRKLWLAHLQRT